MGNRYFAKKYSYLGECSGILSQNTLHVMVHHSNTGMSVITSVDFELTSELDSTTPTFTLTCTSLTGGPITTVTWMRDGEVLTESSNYNITSWMLLHPENATYTHTLRVTGRLVGEYECKLSNIRTPSSSRNLTVEGGYSSFYT